MPGSRSWTPRGVLGLSLRSLPSTPPSSGLSSCNKIAGERAPAPVSLAVRSLCPSPEPLMSAQDQRLGLSSHHPCRLLSFDLTFLLISVNHFKQAYFGNIQTPHGPILQMRQPRLSEVQ